MACGGFKRLPCHPLHAARIAAEQDADFVVRTVALVNADFLPFALRKIHQFGRNREAGRLLEQRPQPAAQRTAGDVGQAKRVLHDRIVGAADFERTFARADVQPGFASDLAFEDQLADQFQFCCAQYANS